MKVLNISSDDYANFSHDNARALRSVGVNCKDVKTDAHEFNYPEESDLVDEEELVALINEADIIQIFHSDVNLLRLCINKGKRLFVYHTGSRYRMNPERYNTKFNPYVERSFIALGEFAGLGAKNETYIVGAVNVPELKERELSIPYEVGHFPSNQKVKGTAKIKEMILKMKSFFYFIYLTDIVDYSEQLKRYDKIDIYIELFNPTLNGKKYGSFGISALEAAARGKIVITQNLSSEIYRENYGLCELVICNNEKEFVDNLNFILELTPYQLKESQKHVKEWIIENHSYKATGERIKSILKL